MKLRHGFFIILAGCGGNSTPATATGDASLDSAIPRDGSASDAATPDDAAAVDAAATDDAAFVDATFDDAGTDAGPPCNTIANDAPVVNTTEIAAEPPAPQGGTIADGTYWATALDIYTGPTGPAGVTGTSQMTTLIQGDTVQIVSSGQPTRRTVTLTTADASFTSVDTCPDSQMSQGAYTATPTTLTIFLPGGTDDAGARTVVETLTKQ
jgi:hypothetical protein